MATVKSANRIDKSVDKQMDKHGATNGHVQPGVSLINGPIEVEKNGHAAKASTNGTNKRKASMTPAKSYKDDSDSDDEPLVRPTSI